MHLVPAPAVRLSCKDECYPDQALTVYWHIVLIHSQSLSLRHWIPFSENLIENEAVSRQQTASQDYSTVDDRCLIG